MHTNVTLAQFFGHEVRVAFKYFAFKKFCELLMNIVEGLHKEEVPRLLRTPDHKVAKPAKFAKRILVIGVVIQT
jgi:hypothetical protein